MNKKFIIIGAIVFMLAAAGGSIAAQGGWENGWEKVSRQAAEETFQEVLIGEGQLNGRIDNNSVEIEVNGEIKAFGLSDEIIEQEFTDGSPVKFEYFIDKNQRGLITKLEVCDQKKDTIMTAAGVFVGFADSHTVEIKVEGEAKAFGLNEGISTANLQKGDNITFKYKENQSGRLVIIELEKKGNDHDKELQSAEGILTGRIDSHSVEIKVNGKHQAFGLSEALLEKEFAVGEISFKYYIDKNGRSIITEADFQKPRKDEIKTAQGIFSGLADNHTVEIEINGKPTSFGLEDYVTFIGVEEGQEIFIAYQEDAARERPVIIKIEVVF
ncbi:hypothetical protein [Candidatus Contubernalis alkaliaceticus]|uniref:hypothetical protein n=1 Tax=Candidatus Contubernalis alkaliaceticus TaxID=338645 RepID=UPI001F4C3A4B|nr:hypothetical protein [Candidatus Contubernalis alkalaceticus]UNC92233.1 hypothetical protein HUE98_09095 [Candidatus Contubernalis alkalaceticus]